MSETPVSGSTHLANNSTNPEVPVNNMVDVVERMSNFVKEWEISGDRIISRDGFCEGFMHELVGSLLSAPFAFGVYPVARFFGVNNTTPQTCTVFVQGSSGSGINVAAGTIALLQSDGINVENVVGGVAVSIAASSVTFDNAISGLYSNTVQEAIDELATRDIPIPQASAIPYDSSISGLYSDTVQEAIDELAGMSGGGGGGGSGSSIYPDFTAPVNASFTWINQGGASVTVNANGGIFLRAPPDPTFELRIRKKSAPSTPWTLTTAIIPCLLDDSYQGCGILMRESATGKLATLFLVSDVQTRIFLQVRNWSDPSNAETPTIYPSIQEGDLFWLRLANDGANLSYSYGRDGYNFITLRTEAKNFYFTTGPDEIGFFAMENTNAFDAGMTLMSWAL